MTIVLAKEAMRTRFEIVLADEDSDPTNLRAAGEEALEEIGRVEQWLSAYREDAALYEINARAAIQPVSADARILDFLQEAQELSAATEGAFDLTIGPLLRVWGLGGGGTVEGRLPDETEIAAARERVGMAHVVRVDRETGTVSFTQDGVRLDPGAIGKGYALERAANLLREAGVRRALLHGGTSTICALGQGWKVALQHPKRPGVRLTTVELHDASLSVSAVHGKSFWMQGKQFGHVIDPRSGRPVMDTLLAAVVTVSATESDALATALLVLGATGILLLADRFPQAAGYLIAEDEPNTQNGLRIVQKGSIWGSIEC